MLLITGATGNIGRELVRHLDDGDIAFRILVRDPLRARGMPGQHVVADLDDPRTLAAAFDDVDRLFLLTQGIGTDQALHAVTAAQNAGVTRIALLSSVHAGLDPVPAMGRWHRAREQIVRASGIPATVLRPGAFMTNTLDWARTITESGFVLDPIGPGRYAPIDPADIAAVAARILTEDGHQGQAYSLTGDETLTVAEQVQIIAEVLGNEIEIRPAATPAEAVQSRFPHGAPAELAAALIENFTAMRADTRGFRTPTVERLLGRRPRTFAAWCLRNADAFRSRAQR